MCLHALATTSSKTAAHVDEIIEYTYDCVNDMHDDETALCLAETREG